MSAFCCWVRFPKIIPELIVIVSPLAPTVFLPAWDEGGIKFSAKVLLIFKKIKNKRKKNNGNLLIYLGISLFKF